MPVKISFNLETTERTIPPQPAPVVIPKVADTPRQALQLPSFPSIKLPKLKLDSNKFYLAGSVAILFCILHKPTSDRIERVFHPTPSKPQAQVVLPKFIHPVDAPISSSYGMRIHPITGKSKLHKGIDYAAATGTPIKAVASGKVSLAKWVQGYGYSVELDHGGGMKSFYAHCSRVLVGLGKEVNQGDAIALVGSTGNSTGPHLHFELDINNATVDPEKYLP